MTLIIIYIIGMFGMHLELTALSDERPPKFSTVILMMVLWPIVISGVAFHKIMED